MTVCSLPYSVTSVCTGLLIAPGPTPPQGMALLAAPVAESEAEARLPTALSIEWYPELQKLPELAANHLRTQLRPAGVIARRLAEPHIYRFDSEKQLKALDLSNLGGCLQLKLTAHDLQLRLVHFHGMQKAGYE